jgi:hypothetical protein
VKELKKQKTFQAHIELPQKKKKKKELVLVIG